MSAASQDLDPGAELRTREPHNPAVNARTFSIADSFETVVDTAPERPAVTAGEQRRSYAELEARCNRCAHHLQSAGIGARDHVGIYARNRMEWVEAMMATYKLRAVPININYRYMAEELRYMFDNAELKALVYECSYAPRVTEARTGQFAPGALLVLADEAGTEDPGNDAIAWETALAAASPERDFAPRSDDDLYILYTGGTTGYPKGTMWRHEDIFFAALMGGNPLGEPVKTPAELSGIVRDGTPMTVVCCAPMMHGGGSWITKIVLLSGGAITLYCEAHFDAHKVLRLVEEQKPMSLMVVGDAMARPLADAMEEHQYELSTLVSFGTGGAMLSPTLKRRLHRLLPHAMILDSFGASETGRLGSVEDLSGADDRIRFKMHDDAAVLDENLQAIAPGSEQTGILCCRGYIPLGYYKDEEKNASTFVTDADGVRWVVTGDHARVHPDGTVELLGRGSQCINSGGEKIFPEEVEGVLKQHPAVYDAVVVGAPHERFGQQVTAVVQAAKGTRPSLEELQAHCKELLSDYKCPRALVLSEQCPRTPPGKPDYRAARALAYAALGVTDNTP